MKINRTIAPKLKRIAFVAIIIILVVFLILALTKSNLFKVQKITVSPAPGSEFKHIDPDEIQESLNELIGQGFFAVDLAKEEKSLLKKNAFIKTIYIDKSFPSIVLVKIEERRPFIILDYNEKCILLDKDSYVMSIDKYLKPEDTQVMEDQGCLKYKKKYNVPTVSVADLKVTFKENTQSNYYKIKDLYTASKVFNGLNYPISVFFIEENKCTAKTYGGQEIIFSVDSNLTLDMKKFVLIAAEIEENSLTFKSLDLRYKKPVMVR